MPSSHDHIQWARLIEGNIQPVLDAGVYNWTAVVSFYSALHYINAYLAKKNIHVFTHPERNSLVAKVSDLQPIFISYQRLSDNAYAVRCSGRTLEESVARQLVTDDFEAVKQQISPLVP